jgi:hypothetical protein
MCVWRRTAVGDADAARKRNAAKSNFEVDSMARCDDRFATEGRTLDIRKSQESGI